MELSDVATQFERDGYAILENFVTEEEVEVLQREMADILDRFDINEHRSIFRTEDQFSDEYFMNSGDKIRFFFEDGALDKDGNILVDKRQAVNKVGHALHCLSPPFNQVSFSEKMQRLAKAIHLKDPVICQSMYIFKHSRIGGKVIAHQDSSFLYTNPTCLVGVWIALEDATIENGCLWFIPGSHKDGVHGNYRMVRKENPQPGSSSTEFIGTPPEYDNSTFVAGVVKKGTAVLIHGEVVHKSEHNHSTKSREAYTFHMFDQAQAKYDERNWLQPTSANTFKRLYPES